MNINKLKTEEIINKDCLVIKEANKLIVRLRFGDISKGRLLAFFITMILWVPLLISLPFYDFTFVYLFILVFLFSLSFPWLLIFIILKYRKREWHFDKSTKSIRYIKGSVESKIIKKIHYNDINFLFYKISESQQLTSSYWHRLFFFILPKQIKFFTGSKESCIRLGVIIGEFLDQSFYYRSGRGKEKIY